MGVPKTSLAVLGVHGGGGPGLGGRGGVGVGRGQSGAPALRGEPLVPLYGVHLLVLRYKIFSEPFRSSRLGGGA